MNKAFLVGRLAAEPDLRTTPNGISVCTLRVAVTRRMNREEADFINVVAWRGLAENCGKYLVKGQQVSVVGEIRTHTYDAKDGSKRYVTEVYADDVEFLAKPGASGAGGGAGYSGQASRPAPKAPAAVDESEMFASEMNGVLVEDEELPF